MTVRSLDDDVATCVFYDKRFRLKVCEHPVVELTVCRPRNS